MSVKTKRVVVRLQEGGEVRVGITITKDRAVFLIEEETPDVEVDNEWLRSIQWLNLKKRVSQIVDEALMISITQTQEWSVFLNAAETAQIAKRFEGAINVVLTWSIGGVKSRLSQNKKIDEVGLMRGTLLKALLLDQ